MAANRPSSFVAIDGGTTYNFPIAPNQTGGGQAVRWTSNPWQMGDVPAIALKDFGFNIPLFPLNGGLASHKRGANSDTYSDANGDASFEGIFVPEPAYGIRRGLNNTTSIKPLEFDGKMFTFGDRYIYYDILAAADLTVSGLMTLDKDLGVGKASLDATVFQNELIVCMGDLENIWRRFKDADTLSGTANAAVTTTNNSLTDTRLTTLTSKYVGTVITCNGKTMTVTSVTGGNTFNGTGGWSGGGNPGNGFAWSMSAWAQYSDAVRGTACCVVDDTFWLGNATTCTVKGALTYPQYTSSYAASYNVGDTSYPIVPTGMIDYQGTLWVGKTNGIYTPDPSGKFHNQSPQLAKWPHADNCKGLFLAHGSLWVPSASGLLKITYGSSIGGGPEVIQMPIILFWATGGVEWGGDIYVTCYDQALTGSAKWYLIKMSRDPNNRNKYKFHQLWTYTVAGTAKTTGMTATTTTPVPYLFFTTTFNGGGGIGNYNYAIILGRSGGRLIDDPLHKFSSNCTVTSGYIFPGGSDGLMTGYIQGVEMVTKLRDANSLLFTQLLEVDGSGVAITLQNTQDGGGSIFYAGPTTGYERKVFYAPAGTKAQFLKVKLLINIAVNNEAGIDRDEIIDAHLFGYLRPKQTDRLIVSLIADGASMNGNGVSSGVSLMDMHTQFSKWCDQATLINVQLQDYQENKNTRFLVTHVERTNIEIENKDHADILQVTLVRLPLAPDYGVV